MCREAKILLVVSCLFTFAMGLSNIFINIFFWNKTNDFIVIAVYNLMHYITTPVAFILAAYFAKKKNGILSLRIGLLIFALFYLLLLYAGSDGVKYIYLLGLLYGVAAGFYWLAFNVLSFDFTSIYNRDTFYGYNGASAGIAAAISPITSAYIISRFEGTLGYKIVFIITLILFLILIFISAILKCENYSQKLNLRRIFFTDCNQWRVLRKSIISWGFRDVIIIFIINILVIETTQNELTLGKLALLASLISSSSYILVQRIIKPPNRRKAILIGTIGSFLAIGGLIMNVSIWTLLFYVVMDAFFLPFFIIQQNSSVFNIIDRNHEEDMRVEYIINKDIALNTGRIISSIILIVLLMKFDNFEILKFYLGFIGLAPVISGYFLRKVIQRS
ncbi:MFS transporter [Clostridium sediminicola]|uniref:MFS transporter n=1 Tax=Clostridium sediminicola TaxID=3114879 RepID=UPI0031F1F89B